MQVRVRLGAGLSRLAVAPVVAGVHAGRDRPLHAGEELALVTPVSGG